MIASDDDDQVRLIRSAGLGRRGVRAATVVMRGPLDEVAQHLKSENPEDLWQFTIVTADEDYIRGAELRALLRDGSAVRRG